MTGRRAPRSTLCFILAAILPTACAGEPPESIPPGRAEPVSLGADPLFPVVVAFGPEGRLWRLRTDGAFLELDVSSDLGVTYRQPVRLHTEGQRIKAGGEMRPSLAVGPDGAIFVTYQRQRGSLYSGDVMLSVSRDDGVTFSPPRPVNDDLEDRGHSFHAMGVNTRGELYVAWLDDRDGNGFHQPGGRPAARGLYAARAASAIEATTAILTNHPIADKHVCECCRVALAFDTDARAVIFTRLALPGNLRDHGLVKMGPRGPLGELRRATWDDWHLEGCPHHGPALAIDSGGRYHLVWFTSSESRQGLYYATTDDGGITFTEAIPLAPDEPTAGRPSLVTHGDTVLVAWRQISAGGRATIGLRRSPDRGVSWQGVRAVASTAGRAEYPQLVTDGVRVILSWQTAVEGHRLFIVDPPGDTPSS